VSSSLVATLAELFDGWIELSWSYGWHTHRSPDYNPASLAFTHFQSDIPMKQLSRRPIPWRQNSKFHRRVQKSSPRSCRSFRNKLFFFTVVVSPSQPQAEWSPTVGCPRLFIEYIRSYPPYLEAVSNNRNLRTRHAVVTGDPLNMGYRPIYIIYFKV
jgi:hypothetical protein